MQERRGVNKLNRRGQMHVIRTFITTELRRRQSHHWTQPFAARFNQMGRHFGNARRMFRGHPIPDQRIHRLHLGAQRLGEALMRFCCGMIEAHHGSVSYSTKVGQAPYVMVMKELLRTNDITIIAFAKALLQGEDIEVFEMDVNMSILDGSLGILPRRLMVRNEDHFIATSVLKENEIDLGF